jgi:hypothetical protein
MEMEIEICPGCQCVKPITDVFDGTLCEECRYIFGLLRPEEASEMSPWQDEYNAVRRIRRLLGPVCVN